MRELVLYLEDAAFIRRTIHRLRDVDANLSVHAEPVDGDGVELRASFGAHVTESAIREVVADCEGVTDCSIADGSRPASPSSARRGVESAWAGYR